VVVVMVLIIIVLLISSEEGFVFSLSNRDGRKEGRTSLVARRLVNLYLPPSPPP